VFRILLAASFALLVVGCGAPKPKEPTLGPGAAPSRKAPAAISGQRYRIDGARSELRVLVYRAGLMASVGHNHVIVNRSLEGWIMEGANVADASFALNVPTAEFVVDQAEARSEEGADFAEVVADDAKAGTLHNMLGPKVLDAAEHPAVSVRSVAIAESGTALEATVAIEVAGHESRLTVPFTLERSSGRLTARGALTVRQTALGLTPLSILLGALRVEDEMGIKFVLIATRDANT
jgi:polyisoprenoid-binding protein YceI